VQGRALPALAGRGGLDQPVFELSGELRLVSVQRREEVESQASVVGSRFNNRWPGTAEIGKPAGKLARQQFTQHRSY